MQGGRESPVNSKDDIARFLERWFSTGDQVALTRAYQALWGRLWAPSDARRALGEQALDEVRQDVLAHLLDRESGALRGKNHPIAYAKNTWRNALTDMLRKWGPREERASEVARHMAQQAPFESGERNQRRLDGQRALEIAASLEGKGRSAVLLTTRPQLLSAEEWASLVSHLPPPPPPPPVRPLEKNEAAELLYPPVPNETVKQRYQRRNTFAKAYKNALARIRVALEDEA